MDIKVGTVFKLKVWCLGNAPGTVGVCYEVYTLGNRLGYGVIFPTGDYDGFSPDDVERFLDIVGFSPGIASYTFTNVMQLGRDHAFGVFNDVFNAFEDKNIKS